MAGRWKTALTVAVMLSFAVLLTAIALPHHSHGHSRISTRAQTPAPTLKPTLLIYGDSLTVLSEGVVQQLYGAKYHLVFRAEGGTSLCDWTAGAATDRAKDKPVRVVIAFTGNSASCSANDFLEHGVAAWVANYQRALVAMHAVFADLPITVVGSPAMEIPRPPGSWYPENGNPALNLMYQETCREYGMRYSSAADDSLTPGHVFVWDRPAYPGTGPPVKVRTRDGVHLLAAGELYYGAALGE